MAQSAFQSNAFQNNAFQIFDTHDGAFAGGWIKRKPGKQAKKLKALYKSISVEIPELPALISAIDPFIEPKTDEELEKRSKAQYITNKAPKASRINFEALVRNELAHERLLGALEKAKAQIEAYRQQEEEIVILFMMMEF